MARLIIPTQVVRRPAHGSGEFRYRASKWHFEHVWHSQSRQ